MSGQLLEVEELNGWYGTAHVLQGVSFSMGAEPVALIGRNGMGKSTLCLAITGLLERAEGSVRLDGEELLGRPAYKVAARGHRLRPAGPAAVRVAHRRRAPRHRRPALECRVDPEAGVRAFPPAG